jgi:translation initiation factor 4G
LTFLANLPPQAEAETKAAALAAEEKKLADANAPAPPAISSPAATTPSGLPALVEGKVSESASPSPATSTPSALSAPPAGLPSKPIEGLPSKPVESAVDEKKKADGPASSAAVAQSIQSAKFVSEPNAVTYPEGISSPKPELNQQAVGGKFRYDREFLLQFMEVCKEKPESLPPLESIGLEADTSSQSGFRRGGGPSRMGSMSGTPRSSQPFNAGSIGRAPVGGSGFGMGNFAGTGKSSAERFAASKSGAGVPFPSQAPSMSRQPSSNTAGGFNAPGSPAAKGSRVRSERGQRRQEAPSFAAQASGITLTEAEIVPLVESANRWIPGAAKRGAPVDENDPAIVDRKVKALLNKLTMENFDSISSQILVWASKSEDEKDGRTLRQVIRLIFEKSTDEAHWSEMYARLCRKMMDTLSDKVQDEKVVDAKGTPFTGGSLFRKYLLNRCQEDFEKGWAARDSTAAAAKDKAGADQEKIKANEAAAAAAEEKGEAAPPKEEAALMSDEYYAAQKAKRQGLGLVRLIGELFKLEMLTERIMHECVKKLLNNITTPEEEDIESLCRLLTTVGKSLDTAKAKHHIDVYFQRIRELRNNPVVSSRMQFMLQVRLLPLLFVRSRDSRC